MRSETADLVNKEIWELISVIRGGGWKSRGSRVQKLVNSVNYTITRGQACYRIGSEKKKLLSHLHIFDELIKCGYGSCKGNVFRPT